jgi:hypothetical protein
MRAARLVRPRPPHTHTPLPRFAPPPSGRKRAALLYVATYALSCATKHSSSYDVLLVGRLLGGVSTSLLFSVFEAWAVAAHAARGFEETLLVGRGRLLRWLLGARGGGSPRVPAEGSRAQANRRHPARHGGRAHSNRHSDPLPRPRPTPPRPPRPTCSPRP